MFNNAIDEERARVILQSAVNNEACEACIEIDHEYRRDRKVQTLMNIMEDRRMKKTNVVGYLV